MDDSVESQALLMKEFVSENKPCRIVGDLVQKKNPAASQMDGGVELAQVAVPHHALPQTLAVDQS